MTSPAKTSIIHPSATNTSRCPDPGKKERTCNSVTGRCKNAFKCKNAFCFDRTAVYDGDSSTWLLGSHCVSVYGSDAFSGVSNIFTFWGSESQGEHTYQEVPCSHSLPSPPPELPSRQLPYPASSSHCPFSPPPPNPSIISQRQKVELENRLDALQRQISRYVIGRCDFLMARQHILLH